MVLIFVKTPEGHTASVDIKFNATVKHLKRLVSRLLDVPRRDQKLIFGGQLLRDDDSLEKYNISKECTVQLIVSNLKDAAANSISSTPLNQSPIKSARNSHSYNQQNVISPFLQFGDLVLVQLIAGKELKKCDFWRQTCDPYVILAMDNFTTKSRIIKKNINPKWNELFCFVVDHQHEEYKRQQQQHQQQQLKQQQKRQQVPAQAQEEEQDGADDDDKERIIGQKIKNKIQKKIQRKVLKGAGCTDQNQLMGNSDDDEQMVQGDAGDALQPMLAAAAAASAPPDTECVLSFLAFGNDRFTPDVFLGSAEINLRCVPYDSVVDLWIPLSHVETGHLHIRLRKCLLSSPMHRKIVFKLMSLERSITVKDLQKEQISLDQLVGNEAWIHGKHDNLSNPALQHLVNILLAHQHHGGGGGGNAKSGKSGKPQPHQHQHHTLLWNLSSLKRIQSILSSQHMLPTAGNPTSYVWVSGLHCDNQQLLFDLISQFVTPKRVFFPPQSATDSEPPHDHDLSFALFEFKSIRDAVFIFITFQHKKFQNMRVLLGFGRRLIFDRHFLRNVQMAGFLSVHKSKCKPKNAASDSSVAPPDSLRPWKLCWCFLKADKLFCFADLQSDRACFVINLQASLLCFTSLKAVEIINKQHADATHFVHHHSKQEMLCWISKFKQIIHRAGSEDADDGDGGISNKEVANEEASETSQVSESPVTPVTTNHEEEEKKESADTPPPSYSLTNDEDNDDSTHVRTDCCTCHQTFSLQQMLSIDREDAFSCIRCLRYAVLSRFDMANLDYLSSHYSICDLLEILSRDEFATFLDLKLSELLESADSFIECASCHSKWEFVPGHTDHDAPDFHREIGIHNKLLSDDAQKHYLLHRVCCRNCNKNFCRSCNVLPYHSGFDCDLYQVYLSADKCRFCATALMPEDTALDPPSEALTLVCNNELCLEKRALSCTKTQPCGHACHGAIDEKYCMSCIVADCEHRHPHVKQQQDDYCNICFTEELSEAPCVELDCGHIFHLECVCKRLDVKQYLDTPAVNFSFARCPLCNIRISHNSLLQNELKQIQTMYKDLEQRAFAQLREEGMLKVVPQEKKSNDDDDDDADDDESKHDEEKTTTEKEEKDGKSVAKITFAMKRYAFYYCFICKNPYFGGLAQCRDVAQGMNASDFVCSPCSGIGQETCKKHGKDCMVYKCKFCCNVASYFCWGNTHFCIDCHKKQENHDFMTTKAKKDLPQCTGPDKCPLKLQHPPNGQEFSIGCSLCRGTDHLYMRNTDPPQNPAPDEASN